MNTHALVSVRTLVAALFVLAATAVAGNLVLAWTNPSGTPPNNNVAAPLNVSATEQTKAGNLRISGNLGVGADPHGTYGIYNYGAGTVQANHAETGHGMYARSDGNHALLSYTYSAGDYGVYGRNMVSVGGGGVIGYNCGTTCGLAATTYGILGYGNGYSLYGNGDVQAKEFTGTAYYYSSDGRLKKDVSSLTGNEASVLRLRPVRYSWIDETRGTEPEIGFIAQEVEKIAPELVSTDASGMKTVDYARVTPLLVGAFQELAATVEAQQAQIEALSAAVEMLKE